ncbi:MAG: hypothetical protein Q8K21_17935 [Hydrogenophaga sp.]|uniref:hypothetical protein n=1 Tax=Hydrogenophaga sp. TaxID=1904254 RepID=UPI00273035F3|nr:hypothetical protein [Hydrogenophaga sp.]MDP2166065.1 hypothetical protein [Hydrogenophaga sp.]MDP3477678.1 hypothetical protein [Hydrogenophaga sp.]
MFTFKTFSPWVACAALAACGGSSDLPDNPVGEPLAITATNYRTVTQEVLMTSFSLVDTSEVLVYGANVSTLPKPLHFARQQLPRLPARVAGIDAVVAGTAYNETVPCESGSVTITFDDRDNNLVVSNGDVLTETFNNCVALGETANGTLRFAFNALTGNLDSDVFTASLTLSFEAFSVESAAGSVLANGTVTLNTASKGVYDQEFRLTAPSYREELNLGGTVTSRTLTNFVTYENITPAPLNPTPPHLFSYSVTVNGTLTSSAFGGRSVVISNITPFSGLDTQAYPPTGQALVTGAASSLRITAMSDSAVYLSVDSNGDGTADFWETRLWSEFL